MIDKIHTKNGSSVEIRSRLSFELDLIRKAGLEQYIFGLAKLLSVAKKNKKPIYLDSLDGEGSFLLYCLGITHRNPLEYNIGLASFLNLERLRMPWFGIICRKEDAKFIYSELEKQFGENKVGLIPDGVGLFLNKTGLGNPVPSVIDEITLERTFQVKTEELEMNGIVPLSLDYEQTLEKIVCIEQLIKQKKPCFSLDLIPDDDSETFAMLSKGETNDLPLLNDNWMCKCLRILNPRNIDDLDALMSLYHNGPTDLIPMYMDAKRGMLSQNYQSIGDNDPLKRTYGVIVYKEQIVDILTQTSACSEADALSICQALTQGKIKPVDQYEDKLEICIAKFYGSTHYAERIIDMIRAFSSEYHKRKIGFWHTTLTYRLAFIRCHYPDLFRNMLDTKPNKRL